MDKSGIKKSIKNSSVGNEKQKIVITDLGKHVTEYLLNNFNEMMQYKFTADMEQTLDNVASGKIKKKKVLFDFRDKLTVWLQAIL